MDYCTRVAGPAAPSPLVVAVVVVVVVGVMVIAACQTNSWKSGRAGARHLGMGPVGGGGWLGELKDIGIPRYKVTAFFNFAPYPGFKSRSSTHLRRVVFAKILSPNKAIRDAGFLLTN